MLALFTLLPTGAIPGQPAQRETPATQHGEPPEEDESMRPKEYSFNPLQAEKEKKVGNYYFKKGNYRAAAMRFEEATRWNSKDAEAWLRLGDARERLKDKKGAREAWQRCAELDPEPKLLEEAKRRLAGKQ